MIHIKFKWGLLDGSGIDLIERVDGTLTNSFGGCE